MKMCQDVDTRVGTPQMYCTKRNYTGMPDNTHTRSGVQIKLVSIKVVFKKFHVKILFWPIVFGPTNFVCPKIFGFKKYLESKKIVRQTLQNLVAKIDGKKIQHQNIKTCTRVWTQQMYRTEKTYTGRGDTAHIC